MIVKRSNLITSALKKSQWPDTEVPEVVMVGRSNAGKSSMINALCNRKNLAYVGKKPGKTRLLNFFSINEEYVLVDAPGYGYADTNFDKAIDFGQMMEDYFQSRTQCKGMILVLDIRRVPSKDDLNMVEFAKYYHVPYLAVLTKADKLSNNEKAKQKQVIAKTLQMDVQDLVLISSEKKIGIDLLWDKMEILLKRESD